MGIEVSGGDGWRERGGGGGGSRYVLAMTHRGCLFIATGGREGGDGRGPGAQRHCTAVRECRREVSAEMKVGN